MGKSKYLLLVAVLFAVPAYAEFEYGVGGAANAVTTKMNGCTGQCDFARNDDHDIPAVLIFSSYYTGYRAFDVGAELHVSGDPALTGMLRHSFGSSSFGLGAGVVYSDIRLQRGDNTSVGDGSMQAQETLPFYVAAYRHQFRKGALFASYAVSSGSMAFNGVVVTSFTIVNGIAFPNFQNTSANVEIERGYARLGYEFRF